MQPNLQRNQVLFAQFASRRIFAQHASRRERGGMVLVVLGLLLLLYGTRGSS